MTEYWREQMGLHDLSETQRAIARDGYREGVADGLRLAATMCERYALDAWGMTEEEHAAQSLAETIRVLIPTEPAG